MKFSSPSGDGLVLYILRIINVEIYFRPRVGMGWFQKLLLTMTQLKLFSSPSGDGLVPVAQYIFDSPIGFRPRLGMGWFPEDIKSKMQYFRPRLGMGWFN